MSTKFDQSFSFRSSEHGEGLQRFMHIQAKGAGEAYLKNILLFKSDIHGKSANCQMIIRVMYTVNGFAAKLTDRVTLWIPTHNNTGIHMQKSARQEIKRKYIRLLNAYIAS